MGLTCRSIKKRTSDYVDGRLRGSELTRFEEHLSECGECELHVDEVRSVRSSLRGLPSSKMPSDLRIRLRIRASRERVALIETDGSRLKRAWNNWKFRIHQWMRPITIPATGGLFSSLALFGAFALTISTTTRAVGYEVPVTYAVHADANLVPMEVRSIVWMKMTTDSNGRITEYNVREGGASIQGNAARLQDNNISLPDFPSVLRFAQPVSSDISIAFRPIVFLP